MATWPKRGVVAEAAPIERERALCAVWPAASLTCAVKVNEPETLGVPVILPEEAPTVRPEGSDPEAMLQLYGAVPPVPVSVAEYVCAWVPAGKEEVVIERELDVGCTPVPDSEMIVGEPAALLPTLTVPLTVPCTDGVNVTAILVLLPGARVIGSVGAPATTNCDGLALILLTVRFAVPELVSATT